MADYGHAAAAGSISLSQAHISDDDSSDQSPPSPPPPPRTSKSSAIKKTKNSHHHQRDQMTATTTMMMIESSSTPEAEFNASSRKPRGRPRGSKNKPKPPVVITRETSDSSSSSSASMKPVILEISAGADVIDSVIAFARRSHVGVSLISASGSVSHVTLRQPVSQAHSLTLHGPFHILSLSGSFYASAPPSSSSSSSFCLTLAGAQGQVFGGVVAGKVTAASLVTVVAATFLNPSVHTLPISSSDEGDGDGDYHHHHRRRQVPVDDQTATKPQPPTESCSGAGKSMPLYAVANPTPLSCQIPPDHHVIHHHWATPSRPSY